MKSLSLVSWILVIALTAHASARPPQSAHDSAEVEAAFVLNLLRFVEWPASAFSGAREPYRIVVIGDNVFANELRKLARGKVVASRGIEVQDLKRDDPFPTPHILLILEEDGKTVRRIVENIRSATVTIGRTKDFLASGGTIRTFIENDLLRFEINLNSANRANVQIGAQVLLLARKIIGVAQTP